MGFLLQGAPELLRDQIGLFGARPDQVTRTTAWLISMEMVLYMVQ